MRSVYAVQAGITRGINSYLKIVTLRGTTGYVQHSKILSNGCVCLTVYNVGVLWMNAWMDRNGFWHEATTQHS